MGRIVFLLIFKCLIASTGFCQQDTGSRQQTPIDSIPEIDSSRINDSLTNILMVDSFSRKPVTKDTGWTIEPGIPFTQQVLQRHPYFGYTARPGYLQIPFKGFGGKELLFYVLLFILFTFAILKNAFAKYFNDLFRLFFRTTLKQRQIREQLLQTPLPSLLFNFFFVVTAGMYISFLLLHYKLIGENEFWFFFLYSCFGLLVVYTIKYIGLTILGWIFNMKEGANSYVFVVFIINKMAGIFLLPFLFLLAFSQGQLYVAVLTLSKVGLGLLLVYRIILTFDVVRNQVRFNLFHFFIYISAFEVAPLLLIYRLLLIFFK